ncbi:unnamed protein product, partial [Chrysoparadoxa australica]
MATDFESKFDIPDAFPAVLREFAKAAIKEQPDPKRINAWAYDYFQRQRHVAPVSNQSLEDEPAPIALACVKGVDPADEAAPPPPMPTGKKRGRTSITNEELLDRIGFIFTEADTDNNGSLSRKEFVTVMHLLLDEVRIEESDLLLVLAEADEDQNGSVDYAEFVPIAADLITSVLAKEKRKASQEERDGDADKEAHDFLLKGMPREELANSIKEVFESCDRDGNGSLDRQEFLKCLRESGLGFTRRELNLVLTMVDRNHDGVIDYDEFAPVCTEMLAKLISQEGQVLPAEEVATAQRVLKLIGEDTVSHSDAIEKLRYGDLGLSMVQVVAIVSDCDTDEQGFIVSKDLAQQCAAIVTALKEVTSGSSHKEYHNIAPSAAICGMEGPAFTAKLEEVLVSGGAVHEKQVDIRNLLQKEFPGLDER